MQRRTKRRILFVFVAICIVVACYAYALLYPQSCFRHAESYETIAIYSESTVDPRWRDVLEEAHSLVQGSELFTDECHYSVFLIRDSLYRRLEGLLAPPVMAKASRNNIFLNAEVDLDSRQLVGPVLKMDLVRTLAHEMTHCLQDGTYGMRDVNQTPLWVREGYAEYVAHADDRAIPSYHLADTLELLQHHDSSKQTHQWMDLHDGIMVPPDYVRYRVLVEYLIDVKGMRYDEIVRSDLTEDAVYGELTEWQASRQ